MILDDMVSHAYIKILADMAPYACNTILDDKVSYAYIIILYDMVS